MKALLPTFFSLLLSLNSLAQCQCKATGDWDDSATWDNCGGGIPTAADDVEIIPGTFLLWGDRTVTVPNGVNAVCKSLTIKGANETITLGLIYSGHDGELVIENGGTLTVAGDLQVTSEAVDGSVVDGLSQATITIEDGGTLDATNYNLAYQDITDGGADAADPKIHVEGTLKVNNITLNNGEIYLNAGGGETQTLEIYGALVSTGGNFNTSATNPSTVKFLGNNQEVINIVNYYDLIVSGTGTTTVNGSLSSANLAHSLTVTSGATLELESGETITTNNDNSDAVITLEAGATLNIGSGGGTNGFPSGFNTNALNTTSTVLYEGAAQTIDGSITYGNLTINGSGTKTLDANVAVNGDLTVNAGTLDIDDKTVTGQAGKEFELDAGTRLNLSGANNFPTSFGTYNLNATSTVDYDLNGAQTVAIQSYGNLDITGGGTKTLAVGEASVTTLLDVEDGATIATDLSTNKMLRLISTGDAAGQTAEIADLTNEGATGVLSGDGFICERDMDLTSPDAVGWNDWASPIDNFRLASWYYNGWPMTGVGGIQGSDYPSNPFCSVLTYDAQISTPYYTFTDDQVIDKNDGWVKAPSITTTWPVGTGFRLYTGARDRELEDIGIPGQGTQVINLNYEATAAAEEEEGWNLIGNPYMSTLDFDLLTRSSANVTDGIWMYSNTDKGYYVYKASIGTGTAPFTVLNNTTIGNGLIPSHKAFWVKTNAGGETLTINESDKVTGGTAYIKSNVNHPKIRVQIQNVNNGNLSAGVILPYEGAKETFDEYDAQIFKTGGSSPNLYFLSEDGKELSINAVPKQATSIPLVIEPNITGDFELRFYDYLEMPTGYCLFFEDTEANLIMDIRESQTVNLSLEDTIDYSERFLFHIKPVVEAKLMSNTSCFGLADGEIMLSNFNEENINLSLYNNQGIEVANETVSNDIVVSGLPAGHYTVREKLTNLGCSSAFSEVEISQPEEVIASFQPSAMEVDLNNESGAVSFENSSTGANTYVWYFSDDETFSYDASPTHNYTTVGVFDVVLVAHNGNVDCTNEITKQITVTTTVGVDENVDVDNTVTAFVTDNKIDLNITFDSSKNVNAHLYDVAGKEINKWHFRNVKQLQKHLELPATKGVYILNVTYNNTNKSFSIVR